MKKLSLSICILLALVTGCSAQFTTNVPGRIGMGSPFGTNHHGSIGALAIFGTNAPAGMTNGSRFSTNRPAGFHDWKELIPANAVYLFAPFGAHSNWLYNVPLLAGYTYTLTNDGSAWEIDDELDMDPANPFASWFPTNGFTSNFVAQGDTLQFTSTNGGPVKSSLRWYITSARNTTAAAGFDSGLAFTGDVPASIYTLTTNVAYVWQKEIIVTGAGISGANGTFQLCTGDPVSLVGNNVADLSYPFYVNSAGYALFRISGNFSWPGAVWWITATLPLGLIQSDGVASYYESTTSTNSPELSTWVGVNPPNPPGSFQWTPGSTNSVPIMTATNAFVPVITIVTNY